MDLFRRNQKYVFIVVAIIIIPSFVLVWGSRGAFSNHQAQREFDVGSIDGKPINYHEFESFRKRIQAAIGGIPLQFDGAPGAGTPVADLYKYIFTYALLLDAQKAGIAVSDLQIGTYLENGHPTVAPLYRRDDPESLQRAVDNVCRQLQMTRQEFLQGVKEWQTIGNYVLADANLVAINSDTIYTYYAFNRAQCVVKRIRLSPTESIKEQAKKDVMEKPAEKLEREVRDYVAQKSADPRYRTPAAWRFAYVFAPFVPETAVREPTEEEIKHQYETGKTYLYNDLPLEEVQERIKSELITQEVDRQTLRNFTIDIDPQLRGQGAELPLDELVKLTPIAKYGVTAGTTGDELLQVSELAKKLPAGSETELRVILDALDAESGPVRDQFMKEWEEGFNLALRPFKADKGYYRLRLLEYRPSSPTEVNEADGSIKPAIMEMALADMIADRVDELVKQQAMEMEQNLRRYSEAKETGGEVDAELAEHLAELPTETITYDQIPDTMYELGRLVVGDLMGPIPYTDGAVKGQEIVLLVDRRVPSREDYEAEPDDIKNRFRQMVFSNFRGNYGFSYSMTGPNAVIHPSPVLLGGLADRFNRREIEVNPELLRSTTNGG